MEAVILQVLATIIEGGARIVKSVRKQFSEAEAKRAYDYLVKVHRKHGWKTMPAENG